MSEEWKSLAQQIADLKRQLAEVTRENVQLKSALDFAEARIAVLLKEKQP